MEVTVFVDLPPSLPWWRHFWTAPKWLELTWAKSSGARGGGAVWALTVKFTLRHSSCWTAATRITNTNTNTRQNIAAWNCNPSIIGYPLRCSDIEGWRWGHSDIYICSLQTTQFVSKQVSKFNWNRNYSLVKKIFQVQLDASVLHSMNWMCAGDILFTSASES